MPYIEVKMGKKIGETSGPPVTQLYTRGKKRPVCNRFVTLLQQLHEALYTAVTESSLLYVKAIRIGFVDVRRKLWA